MSLKIIVKTNRTTTGWEELLGHGCENDSQILSYVTLFNGTCYSQDFRAISEDFDCGAYLQGEINVG